MTIRRKIMEKYRTYEPRKPENPPIALRMVPHRGGDLIVSPEFGPNTYNNNTEEMQKSYSHSSELGTFLKFSLRPALTEESIAAAAYNFDEEAKPQIFDPRWLQAGRIVRTQEGVFTNTQKTDKSTLRQMLRQAKKVNGIYLINDQIAYAPYESFKKGVQEAGDFAEGGLARALEYTEGKKAENLYKIAKSYPNGVNVWGFDKVSEPVSRVVSLFSYYGRLNVYGYYWGGDSDNGCAFGVFASA